LTEPAMSKAFTRESDDAPDLPATPRRSALPPGAKNYLTAAGERSMREELERLLNSERPALAATNSDAESKTRLSQVDQRILELQQSLQTAVVVPPPSADMPADRVRFGATVTVRQRGVQTRYRIVGVDEADFDRGWVSWLSPIAKALVNTRTGQRVKFKFPSGEEELEIVAVNYE
jgi:transcription elongation factor GreB